MSSIVNYILNNDIAKLREVYRSKEVNPNDNIKTLGLTPLHLAVCFAEDESSNRLIRMLLKLGCDPNVRAKSYDRVTPVHVAVLWLRIDALKILLEAGGNPELTDDNGNDVMNFLKIKSADCQINDIVDALISYYDTYQHKLCKSNRVISKRIQNLQALQLEQSMEAITLSPIREENLENKPPCGENQIPMNFITENRPKYKLLENDCENLSPIRPKNIDRRFIRYPFKMGCVLEGLIPIPKHISEASFSEEIRSPRKKSETCHHFNYLLLDTRRTLNLPSLKDSLDPLNMFRIFVLSIFYVGKGTKARPHHHLREAKAKYARGIPSIDHKETRIMEIWKSGHGVQSLHCFQNISDSEAFYNEYCMIKALGLKNLTNQINGNGTTFPPNVDENELNTYGISLIGRAMDIYMAEGEHPLKPDNVY